MKIVLQDKTIELSLDEFVIIRDTVVELARLLNPHEDAKEKL